MALLVMLMRVLTGVVRCVLPMEAMEAVEVDWRSQNGAACSKVGEAQKLRRKRRTVSAHRAEAEELSLPRERRQSSGGHGLRMDDPQGLPRRALGGVVHTPGGEGNSVQVPLRRR